MSGVSCLLHFAADNWQLATDQIMKLWGGRFTGEADQHFAAYNASFRFDQRLLAADLQGCIVQAKALGKAAILQEEEVEKIVSGLQQIAEQAQDSAYLLRPEFAKTEDVHSFIEARLVSGERAQLGSGISLQEVAGGWQFRTVAASAEYVRRFLKVKPQRLTRAAVETLTDKIAGILDLL